MVLNLSPSLEFRNWHSIKIIWLTSYSVKPISLIKSHLEFCTFWDSSTEMVLILMAFSEPTKPPKLMFKHSLDLLKKRVTMSLSFKTILSRTLQFKDLITNKLASKSLKNSKDSTKSRITRQASSKS
jgi:hypothetical protein